MRRGTTLAVVAVALLAVLGYCGFSSARPASRHEYRISAVQAAQAAHDALATVELATPKLHDGPYLRVLIEDGRERVSTALQSFLSLRPPPDPDLRTMRDQLVPLVNSVLSEISGKGANAEASAAGLDEFLERYG